MATLPSTLGSPSMATIVGSKTSNLSKIESTAALSGRAFIFIALVAALSSVCCWLRLNTKFPVAESSKPLSAISRPSIPKSSLTFNVFETAFAPST